MIAQFLQNGPVLFFLAVGIMGPNVWAEEAVWQLGDLTLVGLSGEVVADYVPLISDAIGPRLLWIAAYCNDDFGYLPSAKILTEGGYETRGLSPDIGFFSPEAEQVTVAKVRQLSEKVGRVLP